MTVYYRGRKSGKAYATPVSYLREGAQVYCFTNGTWWHNFKEPRAVELRIRRHVHSGLAIASPASLPANIAIMGRYFKAVPTDAKFYGVSFEGATGSAAREPDMNTVSRAAQGMIMIATRLGPTPA